MKETLIAFSFIFVSFSLCFSYSGGSGTSGDPWQISDPDDLQELMDTSVDWDNYFKQTAVINCYGLSSPNPIGNSTTPFSGKYDGQGFYIENLEIDMPSTDYVGLFGFCSDANLNEINLINATVSGNYYVGSLCGFMTDLVSVNECFTHGNVSGSYYVGGMIGYVTSSVIVSITKSKSYTNVYGNGSYIGGFIGRFYFNYTGDYSSSANAFEECYSTGDVSLSSRMIRFNIGGFIGYFYLSNVSFSMFNDCYSTGSVSSDLGYYVGGFIGYLASASISNCYSIGSATGSSYVGGFIGYGALNSISSCYWDIEASGNSTSAGGSGRTTSQMKTQSNYSGWDFTNVWTKNTIDYPKLGYGKYSGGNGTYSDPWQISNSDDLQELMDTPADWNNFFKQNYDFDCINMTDPSPIGNSTTPFTGGYNGRGCFINNLQINMPSTNYVGLFGNCVSADLNGIMLINANISGSYYVGTLCGKMTNSVKVNWCLTQGNVSGTYYVGGLIGYVYSNKTINITFSKSDADVSGSGNYLGGFIGRFYYVYSEDYPSDNIYFEKCCSSGSVSSNSGSDYLGGFIGYFYLSNVNFYLLKNCYSTASVSSSGGYYLGGFIGYIFNATNYNCYSIGSVTGSGYVGGLIGYGAQSFISSSYWDTEESGNSSSYLGNGRTTLQMQSQSNYSGWDFFNVWSLSSYEYPRLRYLPELECYGLLGIAGIISGDKIYRSTSDLSAAQYSTLYVNSSAYLKLVAANSVTLYPGFKTYPGARVVIQISDEPCLATLYKVVINHIEKEINIESEPVTKVYPNPNAGLFTLEISDAENIKKNIAITDMLGHQIFKIQNTNDDEFILDISNSPRGIYILTVFIENAKYSTKIILE